MAPLLAPIAMLSHCGLVVGILFGANARWSRQRRQDHFPRIVSVVEKFAPHMFAALVAFWVIATWLPEAAAWYAPLLLGAAQAISLVLITSSTTMGTLTRRLGLFLVPSETTGLKELPQRLPHPFRAGAGGFTADCSRARTIAGNFDTFSGKSGFHRRDYTALVVSHFFS